MKKAMIFLVGLLGFSTLQAQELKTFQDSLSYALGVLWGQNIKQQGFTDINTAIFAQSVQDVLKSKSGPLDIKSCNQMVRDYTDKAKEADKKKNMAIGDAFLTENGKRQGVVTLPSGLQYEVLTEGTGAIPKSTDKVSVHYTGKLIDGTVFDSSVQRGQPASFPVTGVIKGWVEALQLMKVGSKWKLFIPQHLAYGDRGAGGQIGPFATLIFEVELLGIE
ncbi:MAG: FKBP-type peptidyl-prolyl cis-trans isomerase [Bacteroidetes bacterium]|nr:FKBP-type peptidyl-prolyl cis-trans isomerase [Bacteroidota bacterium]